jgi:hypothetical protein
MLVQKLECFRLFTPKTIAKSENHRLMNFGPGKKEKGKNYSCRLVKRRSFIPECWILLAYKHSNWPVYYLGQLFLLGLTYLFFTFQALKI